MKFKIAQSVEIIEQINGDDTPLGARGEIVGIWGADPDATYIVLLGNGEKYYTDGTNLR